MTTATRVVLVMATKAMIENSVVMKSVEKGRMPCWTTSSRAASELASWSMGTVRAAAMETRT